MKKSPTANSRWTNPPTPHIPVFSLSYVFSSLRVYIHGVLGPRKPFLGVSTRHNPISSEIYAFSLQFTAGDSCPPCSFLLFPHISTTFLPPSESSIFPVKPLPRDSCTHNCISYPLNRLWWHLHPTFLVVPMDSCLQFQIKSTYCRSCRAQDTSCCV